MESNDAQLQYIQNFLIELAEGNFSLKLIVSEAEDEQTQAVKIGINMLVEELSSTTISRSFFNSIYNGINDILIVVDDNGIIQNINQVTEEELMYKEKELQNHLINKIVQLNDINIVRTHLRNALIFPKMKDIGVNFITKENGIIPVSCSFTLLRDFSSKKNQILIVAKNISALLNARDQLRDKNDELNLFVYKASHDLKSPVSSMQGLTYLMKKSNDYEELKSYIPLMEKSLSNLDVILNELLIIGRITYGELELKPIELQQIFDSIFNSVIQVKDSVTLRLTIEEGVKFILTEKGLFQSILFNLIDNAYKYRNAMEQPFIHIVLVRTNNGIKITIEDNGCGIKEEEQKNIFKMFYRAHETSQGTGLGLYIVKTSLTKLGGSISLESNYGKGSKFTIQLPCDVV